MTSDMAVQSSEKLTAILHLYLTYDHFSVKNVVVSFHF